MTDDGRSGSDDAPPSLPGIPGGEEASWSPVESDDLPPLPGPDPATAGPFGMLSGDPLTSAPAPAPAAAPTVPYANPRPPATTELVPAAASHPAPPPAAHPPPTMPPPPAGLPASPSGYTTAPPPGAFAPHVQPQAGPYELSGWWRRAGALIIDSILMSIVFLILVLILVAVFGGLNTGAVGTAAGVAIGILGWAAVTFLYQPVIMARTNGKTIGKMVTGIRVIRTNGQPMDFGQAALRQVVVIQLLFGVVGSFLFYLPLLLDYLWPLWDAENRALHDMICKTRVVRT